MAIFRQLSAFRADWEKLHAAVNPIHAS